MIAAEEKERREVKYIYYIAIILVVTAGLSVSANAQKPPANGLKGLHRVSNTSNVRSTTRIRRIQDGTSNTIMVSVRQRSQWTAPATDIGTASF